MYTKDAYFAPTLEIIDVIVEDGICATGDGTIGGVVDDMSFPDSITGSVGGAYNED